MIKELKRILGIVLIILGAIGLFLPFLQGILLIIAGLILLDGKRFKKIIKKIKRKFKKK